LIEQSAAHSVRGRVASPVWFCAIVFGLASRAYASDWKSKRDVRLRGELVFVDQSVEDVTAAHAVEVDQIAGRVLVARRWRLERGPLVACPVRPVLVVGR
jgi:hypothetical protein